MSMSTRLPRVAFVTEQYEHVNSGPGTFASYLRDAVERGLLDITFFTDDIQTRQAEYEYPVALPVRLPSPLGHFLREYSYHQAFLAAHQKKAFDLLWYNSAHTGFISSIFRRKVPLILMINDYQNAISIDTMRAIRVFGIYRTITRRLWRYVERMAAIRAETIIVNSLFLKNEIAHGYAVERNKIEVLRKGVDLHLFKRRSLWQDINTSDIKILFIKNNYIPGGLFELLEALSKFPHPTTLTVIGPPPNEFPIIRGAAERIGYLGKLNLVGRVQRNLIPEYISSHDIFCVPSRAEALGVAFLEALAVGVPVVATDVGGIPEVLDNGKAGWLTPVSDPDKLRMCLEEVVVNRQERLQKILYGWEHVKNFTIEAMISRFNVLATQVLLSNHS